MASRLDPRLVRLEAARSGAWRAWQGVPLDQWPDAALMAYLAEEVGLPEPAPGTDLATWMTDAELQAIAAGNPLPGCAP